MISLKMTSYILMESHSKMREPGIVLDSRKNMMINLAFNYLLMKTIEIKCWLPANHVLQLLLIQSVKTSGHHHTFPESELKDTLKQFTENLLNLICTYHRNLFFNFKQFDHCWKLLKTLDFNPYQGFLFLFFIKVLLVISMNLYMK